MHPIFPVEGGVVRMKPIGRVVSPLREQQTGGLTETRARVEVDPALTPLLEGISEFSHVWVLYWMSEVTEHSVIRHPQGRDDVPASGMLANR